jgi:hypothetical protein
VTPTPTVTPTPSDGEYATDSRFETGYPMVIMGSKTDNSTNLTIKLKLKEGIASADKPASIYYIVTTDNLDWDVSSSSVIHGHLGTDQDYEDGTKEHYLVYATELGAHKITDSNEVEIPLTINRSAEDGLITYFVIKTETKTSEVPTRIAFDGDTVSGFIDLYPPVVDATYWSHPTTILDGSQEQRTVRVFVNEELNTTSTVSGSAFSVSSVSGASITAVTIHKSSSERFEPYQNWIDLTLTYPTGSDLGNMTIDYIPPVSGGFVDKANIPHLMEAFTLYKKAPENDPYFIDRYVLKDADPIILSADISDDGKYMCLKLSPRFDIEGEFNYRVNNEEWTYFTTSYSYDYCNIYIRNSNALVAAESYGIVITNADGGKIKDIMGQEYTSVQGNITNPTITTIQAESASFNLTDKQLRLTLAGNCDSLNDITYACQYVLATEGASYQLRGRASTVFDENGKMVVVFNEENMFDVDLTKFTGKPQTTFSLKSLSEGDAHNYLTESSGKPLTDFEVNVSYID